MKKLLAAILVFIATVGDLAAADTGIELLKPYGQDIYMSRYAAVVIDLKESGATGVTVRVGDGEIVERTIPKEKKFFCFTIELYEGVNKIAVEVFNRNRSLFKAVRTVYRGSLIDKKFKYSTRFFHKQFFHKTEKEKVCSGCHNMNMNEEEGVAFENITDSNCYSCHYPITTDKFLHAPAANWLCATSCHTGETGRFNRKYRGQSKYISPDPVADRCFSCHKEFKKKFYSENYRHEPVDNGRCNRCHDPHGSNISNKFLRKNVWYLCTSCHTDKKDRGHVVRTFSGKSHPTKGVKDPTSEDGRELSCISCHNPHVSNNGFMLRGYMGKGTMLWCKRCHKK
ncbi:cytochrome c family protein [Hydrogenimonas sp.]|nr:cytochrome c family protein [Hydrogenimonas sp.]